jgi:hypothetical protein
VQRKSGRISSKQHLSVAREEFHIQVEIKFLRDDGNHRENVLTQFGVAGDFHLA